jgi:hypothetical protein
MSTHWFNSNPRRNPTFHALALLSNVVLSVKTVSGLVFLMCKWALLVVKHLLVLNSLLLLEFVQEVAKPWSAGR